MPVIPAPNLNDLLAHIISSGRFLKAFPDTILKGLANAVCPDAQCVDGNSEAIRQVFAVFYLGPFFFLIVLKNQFAIFRSKLASA